MTNEQIAITALFVFVILIGIALQWMLKHFSERFNQVYKDLLAQSERHEANLREIAEALKVKHD